MYSLIIKYVSENIIPYNFMLTLFYNLDKYFNLKHLCLFKLKI